MVGLVDAEALKPADLVGVNKDSYLILDTLPAEYDSRVKAMEVDEKPTEDYSDIGGLDKQVGFEEHPAQDVSTITLRPLLMQKPNSVLNVDFQNEHLTFL